MEPRIHWIPSSLVLLAVCALAATVPANSMLLDATFIALAVSLLIASYTLRHRARKQLIYRRDPDKEYQSNSSSGTTPPNAPAPPRRPRP